MDFTFEEIVKILLGLLVLGVIGVAIYFFRGSLSDFFDNMIT